MLERAFFLGLARKIVEAQHSVEILNRCITDLSDGTANLDHALGQAPNRVPATTAPSSLEIHNVLPALRARRMDQPDHPRADNDIVEQY